MLFLVEGGNSSFECCHPIPTRSPPLHVVRSPEEGNGSSHLVEKPWSSAQFWYLYLHPPSSLMLRPPGLVLSKTILCILDLRRLLCAKSLQLVVGYQWLKKTDATTMGPRVSHFLLSNSWACFTLNLLDASCCGWPNIRPFPGILFQNWT